MRVLHFLREERAIPLCSNKKMSPEDFRHHGHQVVDWITDYLAPPERHPVLPKIKPGELTATLPPSGPDRAEPMDAILVDFAKRIVPASTHPNDTGFLGFLCT